MDYLKQSVSGVVDYSEPKQAPIGASLAVTLDSLRRTLPTHYIFLVSMPSGILLGDGLEMKLGRIVSYD